ncbi:hypothetical protein D3C87_1067990 [compost metagenome]
MLGRVTRLGLHLACHQRLLGGRQPLGVDRLLGQEHQHRHTGQHRRNPLDHEQPLPVGQAVHAVHRAHDEAGQRAADHAGNRKRGHEQAVDAGAAVSREPVGQVQHHAREEARLENPQQEAQRVELPRRLDEDHRHRGQAPKNGDARQRLARADLLQQQVARHLEQEVADEENPRAQAVHGLAELQVLEHLELGEAHVDAVDPGQDEQEYEEWDQAHGDLAVRLVALLSQFRGRQALQGARGAGHHGRHR